MNHLVNVYLVKIYFSLLIEMRTQSNAFYQYDIDMATQGSEIFHFTLQMIPYMQSELLWLF